jgi:hypothetical protein
MVKKDTLRKAWQIRVDLTGIRTPVWRRILVPDHIHLLALHELIQAAFGWQDYHLHEFEIHGARYGDPETDEFGEFDLIDERETELRELGLTEGDRFTYEYDFGDSWRHTILLEKILTVEKRARLPRCLGGQRACPPEDVGGTSGYAEFLEALTDPGHPKQRRYLEWVGGVFDPEAFDLKAANARIADRARVNRGDIWVLPYEGGSTSDWGAYVFSVQVTPAAERHEETARNLPLRRDVCALISYIRDNKVTGTSSTGNLPLKTVTDVSSAFVNPPLLETRIGNVVYRFRSEEEVWPVFFVHKLAHGAELVEGGSGRRWRLTQWGEEFFSKSAVAQVFILLHAWWYRVNWLIAVPFDIFGGSLSHFVPSTILKLLRELRIDQTVRYETFVDRLIDEVGWTWDRQEPDDTRSLINRAVENILVDPLEQLAVLSTQRMTEHVKEGISHFERTTLVSFALTDFGHTLIEGL